MVKEALQQLVTPAITTPARGTVIDLGAQTIAGSKAIADATVSLFRDLMPQPLGETQTISPEGDWSISITLDKPDVGELILLVQQKNETDSSAVSEAYPLMVRPSALAHFESRLTTQGNVICSGYSDFPGATVTVECNGPAGRIELSDTVRDDGQWRVEFPAVVPGPYNFSALQRVAQIASASTAGTAVAVAVPTPVFESLHVVDQVPTFKGIGHQWAGQNAARVEVWIADGAAQSSAEVIDGRWEITGKEWAPGAYHIGFQQVFNTLRSAYVMLEPDALIVTPVSPTIDQPLPDAVIDEQTPTFAGRAIANASVELRTLDGDVFGPTVADALGGWTFQVAADTPLAPISQTLQARQVVQGIASEWVSCTFRVTVPEPEFTTPSDNDVVDAPPQVQGRGWPRADIFVYREDGIPMGQAMVKPDMTWTMQLANAPSGPCTIRALQVVDGYASALSEDRHFVVQTHAPVILGPAANAYVQREATVSGTAVAGSVIGLEVKIDQRLQPAVENIRVNANGEWSAAIAPTPDVGPATVQAFQDYYGESKPSPIVSFNVTPQTPVFDSEWDGSTVGPWPLISGKGYPGDTMVVVTGVSTVLMTSMVDVDGNWQHPPDSGLQAPTAVLKVKAWRHATTTFDSPYSPDISLAVDPLIAQILMPQSHTRVVRGKVNICGRGLAGATIDLFVNEDASPIATKIPVTVEGWQVEVAMDDPAPMKVVAVQSKELLCATSPVQVFDVVPAAPEFTSPQPGSAETGWLTFRGTGFTGDTVEVFDASDEADVLAVGSVYGDKWVAPSNRRLPLGEISVSARQSRGGQQSDVTEPLTFKIVT
jgi:hypothetical protein